MRQNSRPNLYVMLFLTFAARVVHQGHHSSPLRWLLPLGGVGLFALAVVDSSLIPLPVPGSTDFVLLLLILHRSDPFLMAACATAGSVIGGYLCWSTGQRGGSVILNRYVSPRLLRPVSRWIERRGRLSVGLGALLPPPIPLMPVLLAAGTLGIPRSRFLTSFTIARAIRYGLLAWLGATFGRRVIGAWSEYLSGWAQVLLWAYILLLVLGVGYGLWKYRKGKNEMERKKGQREDHPPAFTYPTQSLPETRSPNEAARHQP
jgi:membrane protein YqaA with SNARE-associated domain